MDNLPIIIERTFHAPVPAVWNAITDAGAMRQWFIPVAEFKPEAGFRFQFMEGDANQKYLHLCEVKDVVPGRKISYTWRYDGYPGDSLVTFELFEEGANTRLRFTHEGVETFAGIGPDFSKESHQKGWNYLVGKALKEFIDK